MSARIAGLGHVGIYVQDLGRMSGFYRDFMGMTLTKSSDAMAFFSSDPERSDHEIALMTGRQSLEDPHLIQQISLRVERWTTCATSTVGSRRRATRSTRW